MKEQTTTEDQLSQTQKKQWIKPEMELIEINKPKDTFETPASGPFS